MRKISVSNFRTSAITKTTSLVIVVIILVVAAVSGFYYIQSAGTTSSTQSKVPCPITLGTTLSFTGAYSTYAVRQNVTLHMAIDEINAHGGILGCPIKLIVYDDQSDVKTIYNNYLRLITVDKVELLIGTAFSVLGQSMSPLFEQYKIPVVHPTVAALLPKLNYSFSLLPYAGNYTKVFFDYLASKAPHSTIAIISDSTAFSLGVAKGANAYANKTGFKVLDFEQFSPQTTDYTGLLNKIKSLNPDIVLGSGYLNEAEQITKEMHGINWTPNAFLFTTGPQLPEFINSTGSLANGIWGVSSWMPYPYSNSPGVKNVTTTFLKLYGALPDDSAMGHYVAVMLTAQAVNSVGSLNYTAIRDYYVHADTTIVGWKIQFDPVSHQDMAGKILIQIQNRTWVVIAPTDLATGTSEYPCPCN